MNRLTRCLTVAVTLFVTMPAWAGEFFETDGVAIRGYDPVAYVEGNSATRGRTEHSFEYKGSKFLFASAGNRDKFAATPEKYAPRYNGFCALGTANGYKVSTQADAFKIVDGRLYLNYDRKVRDLWMKDEPGYIAKADANWPEVSKQKQRD